MGLPFPPFAVSLNGMATPGELVKAVAKATGTPEPTVTQHDRNIFIAGLRTKGGRGPSAPKVTPRDAAHLLTALLGSERVQDSVETVLRYSDTVESHSWRAKTYPKDYKPLDVPPFDTLPEDHSFIDALERLIELAMSDAYEELFGREPLYCQIFVTWPHTHARITLSPDWRTAAKSRGGAQADYGRYTGYAGGRPPKKPKERHGPIERSAHILATPVRYIGALLGNRLDKVSLENKLAGTW